MATGIETLEKLERAAAAGQLSAVGTQTLTKLRQAAAAGQLSGAGGETTPRGLAGRVVSTMGDVARASVATPERGELVGTLTGGTLGLLGGPELSPFTAAMGGVAGRTLGGERRPEAIAGAGARGAVLQATGEAVGPVVGMVARPLARVFPRFARLAERFSPGVLRLSERTAEATDVGGTARPAYAAGKAVIGAREAGGSFEAGGVQAALSRGRQWRDALFDDLASHPGVSTTPLTATRLPAAAAQVPQDLPASVATLGLSKNAKDALAIGVAGKELSFAQARLLDKELGRLAFRGGDRPTQYLAGQLQEAVRGDIEDFLQGIGPEAGETFQQALGAHRTLRSVEESSIRALVRKNPEDVTRVLFAPGNVREAMDLQRVLPEAEWKDLVQSGFDRITGHLVDASGRMGPKEALKFAKTIQRLGETEQLTVLAGPEQARQLTALAKEFGAQFGKPRSLTGSVLLRAGPLALVGEEYHRGALGRDARLLPLLALAHPAGRRLATTLGAQLLGHMGPDEGETIRRAFAP